MKETLFTIGMALLTTSWAVPWRQPAGWSDNCLSPEDATGIVEDFITMLEHTNVGAANATAQSLLAEGFVENSDSILTLQGRPLGGAAFEGKQAYINGVLNAPSVQGINTLDAVVAGCTKVL